jgi:hypothetical protein
LYVLREEVKIDIDLENKFGVRTYSSLTLTILLRSQRLAFAIDRFVTIFLTASLFIGATQWRF